MLYRNDTNASVEIGFQAERDQYVFGKVAYRPIPHDVVLILDGKRFNLDSKDPATVLRDMRVWLGIQHEYDMGLQADAEMPEAFVEAAE